MGKTMKFKVNLILLIAFFIEICLPNFVMASTEDISVYELPSLITDKEGKGYSVYRFSLQNNTSKRQTVDIELENKNTYDSGEGYIVSKQVELTAGESREEKIIFPNTFSRNDTEVYFAVKGKIVKKLSPKSGLSVSKGYYYDAYHVLIDRKITNLDTDKLFRDPGLDYRSREKYKTYYFESNLDLLDREWLSYSQFDALLFYNDTFEDIPESIQKGIFDYVRVGGHLLILGEFNDQRLLDEINGVKKEIKGENKSENKSESKNLSDAIKGLDSYLKPNARRSVASSRGQSQTASFSTGEDALINYKNFGLGRITFLKKDVFELLKETVEEEKSTGSSYSSSRYSRKEDNDSKKSKKIDNSGKIYVPKKVLGNFDYNKTLIFSKDGFSSFKLTDCYRSKYQAFAGSPIFLAFLVVLFALLIGPINLFILHKYNQKIMVFLSVPIISLICCSILFLYFLMFEYGRLDYFRQSFTILDETSNTSYTIGGGIIIAGRNMNNELVFPLSSAVIPSSMSWKDKSINTSKKSIKLDKAQNLTYNWIKAKSPFCYTVTTIKQDRSRLEIKKSGKEYDLLNGLGADLLSVYLLGDDGNIYKANNIKAGATGKAEFNFTQKGGNRKTAAISYYYLFAKYNDIRQCEESMFDYAKSTLKKGEYIALLSKDPFLKQGLEKKAEVHELGCFVHGISDFGGSK